MLSFDFKAVDDLENRYNHLEIFTHEFIRYLWHPYRIEDAFHIAAWENGGEWKLPMNYVTLAARESNRLKRQKRLNSDNSSLLVGETSQYLRSDTIQ